MIYYGKWKEFSGFSSSDNTYKTIVLDGTEYIVAGIEIAQDGTEWVIIVKEHIGLDGNVSEDKYNNKNYYFARINLETLELPDETLDRSNKVNMTTVGKVPYTELGVEAEISTDPFAIGVTLNGVTFDFTHRGFSQIALDASLHKVYDANDSTLINMFVVNETDTWAWARAAKQLDYGSTGYIYRKVLRIDNLAKVGARGADGNLYTSIMAPLEPYQYDHGNIDPVTLTSHVKEQSLEAAFGFDSGFFATTYDSDTLGHFIGLTDFYPIITINGNDYGFRGIMKRPVAGDLVLDSNGFFVDQSPRSGAVLTKPSPIFNYLNPDNGTFVKSLPGITESLYNNAVASGSALEIWTTLRNNIEIGGSYKRPYLNDYLQFKFHDNNISNLHSRLLTGEDLNVLEWHLVEVKADSNGIITTKKKDYWSWRDDGVNVIGHNIELNPYVGIHPIGFNQFTSIQGPGWDDEAQQDWLPHLDNTWWDHSWADSSDLVPNGKTATPYKKVQRNTGSLDISQVNSEYHVNRYNTIDTYPGNPTEGCWTGAVKDPLTNIESNTFLHAQWTDSIDSSNGDPIRNAVAHLPLNRILFAEQLPYNELYKTSELCLAAGYEWTDAQILYTPYESATHKWSCSFGGNPYNPDTWNLYEYEYGQNGNMGYGDWLDAYDETDGWDTFSDLDDE